MFTARYALSPNITQIRFVFKGLMYVQRETSVGTGTQYRICIEKVSPAQNSHEVMLFFPHIVMPPMLNIY